MGTMRGQGSGEARLTLLSFSKPLPTPGAAAGGLPTLFSPHTPHTHTHARQPAAIAAAAAAYEATALLTAATLAGLWAWSRRGAATTTATATATPPLLSIPALAVLFGLQWPAFTYLFVQACCQS